MIKISQLEEKTALYIYRDDFTYNKTKLTFFFVPVKSKTPHFELVMSKQGKLLLCVNGQKFRKRSGTGNIVYWSCLQNRKLSCKARITQHTVDGKITFSGSHGHNHELINTNNDESN